MRSYFLFILTCTLLVCTACHTRKQVQTQQHIVSHTADTVAVQASESVHTVIDSISTSASGKDIVIDVVETVEHYDTLGRVTEKRTKKTNIHHRDSVSTVTNQHTVTADTSQVVSIQSSRKDSDVTVKEKKKTSWGSVMLEVALGVIIIIVIFFGIKAAKYILCRM